MKNRILPTLFCLLAMIPPAWSQENFPIKSETITNMVNQAKSLKAQYRYREALETFRQVESLFPQKDHILDAQLFEQMGYCNLALKNYDQAEREFNTAYSKFNKLGADGYTPSLQVLEALRLVAAEKKANAPFKFDFNPAPSSKQNDDQRPNMLIQPSSSEDQHLKPSPFSTNSTEPLQKSNMFAPSSNFPNLTKPSVTTTFSPTAPALTDPPPADAAWRDAMKKLDQTVEKLRLQ